MGLSAAGVSQTTKQTAKPAINNNDAKSNASGDSTDGEKSTSTNTGGQKTTTSSSRMSNSAQEAQNMMNKYSNFTPPPPSQQQDPNAMAAQMAAMQGMKPQQAPQAQQGGQKQPGGSNDSIKEAIRTIAKDQDAFKNKISEQIAEIKKGDSGEKSEKDAPQKALDTLNGKEEKEIKAPQTKEDSKTTSIDAEEYDGDSGFNITALDVSDDSVLEDVEEALG